MLHFLTIGTVLGLSAGFSPGPLLTLVVAETLQHDVKSGIKVAAAPLLTDLPIIILTLLLLSRLSSFNSILGIVTLLGGCFVLYLGYGSLCTKGVTLAPPAGKSKSLFKGAMTNMLSPHPYLFWLSVGAPTMTKAMNHNTWAAASFIIAFYFFLIGSKITLAVLVGKTRTFLCGKAYIYTMRLLGLSLCVLAMVLLHDGMQLLEVL